MLIRRRVVWIDRRSVSGLEVSSRRLVSKMSIPLRFSQGLRVGMSEVIKRFEGSVGGVWSTTTPRRWVARWGAAVVIVRRRMSVVVPWRLVQWWLVRWMIHSRWRCAVEYSRVGWADARRWT